MWGGGGFNSVSLHSTYIIIVVHMFNYDDAICLTLLLLYLLTYYTF